ncbi:MAG: RIP metalloprotease RseP [Bacteroidales bacterium]
MEILIKVAQLILSLSILVILHEFGHFILAKLFNTRVEKFYLFFNPGFSLFKFRKGETEYGMGWLPLGGYVKISGMIDESMDKDQMKKPPQPYEFRSKPSWQRLLIMLGGVMMNFILAILIYASILFVWGEQYLPADNVKHGIAADSLAESIGFQDGDKVVSVEGKKVERFSEIPKSILLNKANHVTVQRNGQRETIHIPDTLFPKIINNPGFISYRVPTVIGGFSENSPAKQTGLQKGDRIVQINGKDVKYFDQLREELKDKKNEEISLKVQRDGELKEYNLTTTSDGLIGFYVGNVNDYYEFEEVNYSFVAAIPAGIDKGIETFREYLKQLGLIFTPDTEAYKEVGGFITIGNIFPGTWNWYAFWNLTAFLSIILAILNVLPIPALDGGHVMFLLYEIVSGQKPSEKFLEYAQIAGMLILFSILIYANGNDIVKLFSN